MNRAIFLDRDNTLIANAGYLGDPKGVKLLDGVVEGLQRWQAQGYKLIAVSNQAGVAHGFFTEAAMKAVDNEMARQLEEQGVHIDASYACLHHPNPKTTDSALRAKYMNPNHPWRKPNPGMLLQAAADFQLDLSASWMVGDSLKDVEAGAAAGCRTVLIKNLALEQSPNAEDATSAVKPNFIVFNLPEAAKMTEQTTAQEFPHP